MAIDKEQIAARLKLLQLSICEAIELEDGTGKFQLDQWQRPGGGGGDTRVIENGSVIEKGGVNFSAVYGELPPNISSALGVESNEFFATGVSIVMHPSNPHVPIIHMNVRYFEMDEDTWWFGGGIDLTPHYVDESQTEWFHNQLVGACVKHDPSYYNRFSEWANNYFYIKHRNESRGVSGIFFDRLNTKSEGKSKDELFQFLLEVGETFAPTYSKLMNQNKGKSFSEIQKAWQMHRRSRYVEFNLVYDKGTKFGLDTNGRIDSILMSLPPDTGWKYTQYWPKDGEEMKTEEILRTRYVPKNSK
ncbi:oxygen-dependent coproporphyrinogen oxidase [bacterium]|nr:oxygen-dependent coproporphyrinogen oxidase [bacterium]MDC1221123.1 oxygen-dependent coproporphyrinogen oxidase [Salibacteraceae bacterium]